MLRRKGLWKLYLALIAVFTILISAVMGLTQAAKASQSADERASECLIAFDRTGQSIVIDAHSGAFRQITNPGEMTGQTLGNGRTRISFSGKSGDSSLDQVRSLYLAQPWLSRTVWLDDLPSGTANVSFYWSPDSQSVIVLIPEYDGAQPVLYDLRNNQKYVLPKSADLGPLFEWTPDSQYLAMQINTGIQPSFMIWSMREAKIVKTGNGSVTGMERIVSWSPEGHHYFYYNLDAQANYTFGMTTPGGSDLMFPKIEGETAAADPVWSEDGQYVAFRGSQHLYIYRADGTTLPPVPITDPVISSDKAAPVWTGHTILTLGDAANGIGLFAYDVESRRNWLITDNIDSQAQGIPFAAKNGRILFAWTDANHTESHADLINLDGTGRISLNINVEFIQEIVWTSDDLGEIYAVDHSNFYYFKTTDNGKNQQRLPDARLVWPTTQNYAAYLDTSKDGSALTLINFDSGSRKILMDNVKFTLESVQWSPDENLIVVVNADTLEMFDAEGHLLWQIPNVGGDYDAPNWTPCF